MRSSVSEGRYVLTNTEPSSYMCGLGLFVPRQDQISFSWFRLSTKHI